MPELKKVGKKKLRKKLEEASKRHQYTEGRDDDGPRLVRRPSLTRNWMTTEHLIEDDGSD